MKTLTSSLLIAMMLLAVSCGKDVTGHGSDWTPPSGDYTVLAWNDLGMHCLNPTYDTAVILPPFNTLYAQVIKKGNPPEIVTTGISVVYSIENNTFSYGKRDYGQFWDNAVPLFGDLFGFTSLSQNVGLTGRRLAGEMDVSGNCFVAEGIPLTPVDDDDVYYPYQLARIVVMNLQDEVIAQTMATAPVSDEINCSRCHGADPWNDILSKHDEENQTDLSNSKPVLCVDCHGSPALGTSGAGMSGKYLSAAIHGAHADRNAACYDCHPGQQAKCMRSVRHTTADGNCVTCHGTMAQVAGSIPSQRIPWVDEPACYACHDDASGVSTGSTLYRNAKGHGDLYCVACHGSPHAMIPSLETRDNYQAMQYQGFTGRIKTLGSCGVCHDNSRGDSEIEEFSEKHGGSDPEQPIGCGMCHTVVPATTAQWPHAHTWSNSN